MVKDCTVSEQHPCTDGHFPGQPVVPGAYLLGVVHSALNDQFPGRRVASLRKVKFSRMLLPGQPAQLEVTARSDQRIQFRLRCGKETMVEGSALLAWL